MSTHDSGFNPDKITFGIEVEVVAAGFAKASFTADFFHDEKILHNVSQRLTDADLEVEIVPDPFRSDKLSYTKWVVREDISIMDNGAIVKLFPSELVQAPLKFGELIWKVLRSFTPYFILFGRKIGKRIFPIDDFPLPTLLIIVYVLVLFERVIEMWVHSGHRGWPGNLEIVKRINGCRTVEELQRVINHAPVAYMACSKHFKYNFMSVTVIRTIEFRQHARTKNVEEIHMWVLFCTALVRAAAVIDGEMIQKMASLQKLMLEDLSQLVGDQFVTYYGGKFHYKLL
ncbi:hypothetical protein RUND412_007054 [Rhizina undulata]